MSSKSLTNGIISPTVVLNGDGVPAAGSGGGKPMLDVPLGPHDGPEPPLLPHMHDEMIPFSDVVQKLAQNAYADLINVAEILPGKTDVARKKAIVEYGSSTRKQVIKALVLARWARDAPIIQKCRDIVAFLRYQNRQYSDAVETFPQMKSILIRARARNYDLLTAIDTMTTGTYLRLPKVLKTWFIHPPRTTPTEAIEILRSMDEVIRQRLRMHEIVPIEMSRYRISNGRVYFTVPGLFHASFGPGGAEKHQLWHLLHIEFLVRVKDPLNIFERFPRIPERAVRDAIIQYCNHQLALRSPPIDPETGAPPPPAPPAPAPVPVPVPRKRSRVKLPPIDAPFVRAFNFLQMFSLTYQLEILHYQAVLLLRKLGWVDYLRMEFSRDRRTLTASYWMKNRPPPPQGHPPWQPSQSKIFGGVVTISLEAKPTQGRNALGKALADLEDRSKAGVRQLRPVVRTMDKVEGMRLRVVWDPAVAWLGVRLGSEFGKEEFDVDANDLDFEAIMSSVITKHANALMRQFHRATRSGAASRIFTDDEILLVPGDSGVLEIHAKIRGEEVTMVRLDVRSGLFVVREAGVFPSVTRDEKVAVFANQVNEKPQMLPDALCMSRLNLVLDDLERKAVYLRTNVSRTMGIVSPSELPKFGPSARLYLRIALASFDSHFLVLVLADQGIRYALLKVEPTIDDDYKIVECAWLDVQQICGADIRGKRRWSIESDVLRDLYAYCRARVAHIELEQQLRDVNIQFDSIFNGNAPDSDSSPTLPYASARLLKSVPTICVQSAAFLRAMTSDASTMSADAWCPNIAFKPVNWWSGATPGVSVSLKLRPGFFVPSVDENSTTGEYAGVTVRLDSKTGVIRFNLERVNGAIVAFVNSWEGVSKAVSVAREVRTMSEEPRFAGVRLLSFTLSSVSLMYNNAMSLTIVSSSNQTTSLVFSYEGPPGGRNPHEDFVELYSGVFEVGGPRKLIEVLQDTLPLLLELQAMDMPRMKVQWKQREAGWVRILYGDARHALDFRLLTGSRMLVVDGSVSLFTPFERSPLVDTSASKAPERAWEGYTPIPAFSTLLLDVTKQIATERKAAGAQRGRMTEIVPVDSGLICEQPVVRTVARAVHEKMMKLLEPG